MALITISEAGRLTGKGRPAIYAAIKASPPNNLSVVAEKGKTLLDPAEVERVFGPFKNRPGAATPAADPVPADQAALIDALRDQIEQLKAAAAKAEAREAAANERALAAESRAASAEAKAGDYLIRLLPAPAPAQEPEKKGFFSRLFG